ncbi:MAG: DNA polymerase III subunit gamma/tau [bacterium]|nr:DNA polymerase III subunit gamma/tau [bacterium]
MSLYRKYRPRDFQSLLGQDHVREVLQGALLKDRVSHAYLFTGPRGTGKTSTARILSRAINCLSPVDGFEPCNTCEICLAALEERLTDLVEIDAASHGLVDDARALVEQARFMPTQARKKIYIIDEVHMLSKSAFNALLKIIEEPPDYVHFILATTESHKVLDTIKSRCQRFDFHLANDQLVIAHLKDVCGAEKVYPDEGALAVLAEHARGSFRDALSLLEQVIDMPELTSQQVMSTLGLSDESSVHRLLDYLFHDDSAQALDMVEELYQQGADLSQFCQSLLEQLRLRLLKDPKNCRLLLDWVAVFYDALDQLRNPIIPQLPLEMAVLKALSFSSAIPSDTSTAALASFEALGTSPVQGSIQGIPHGMDPAQSQDANELLPQSDPGFDRDALLNAVQHVPLRTLLRYSQLSFSDQQLTIQPRSAFEVNKMKQKELLSQLMEAAQGQFGQDVSLHFVVRPQELSPLDRMLSPGIRSQDLKSVF